MSAHRPVIVGRLATYNTQVPGHRDGANSYLLDSVFYVGKHYEGGRLILPQLGVSLCGDHGYSVHAYFRILEHGVSHILATSPDNPPLRISLALYSHDDVFAGAAKLSAAKSGAGVFSDPAMWLPFPPSGFTVKDCRARLAKEERDWRKKYEAALKATDPNDSKNPDTTKEEAGGAGVGFHDGKQ